MAEYIDERYIVLDGLLLSYKSDEEYVTIPESIGGVPIRTIGQGAFAFHGCKGVVLSDGIEKINRSAFAHCENLQYVTIFPSIKKIETKAFDYDAMLEKVFQIVSYTEEEYRKLKERCFNNGGSLYMAYELPDIGDNYYVPDEAFGIGKTQRMPKGIKRLFVSHKNTRGFPLLFDFPFNAVSGFKEIFRPHDAKEAKDEKEALTYLMKEGFPKPEPMVELRCRKMLKNRHEFDAESSAHTSRVFLFDDANTRIIGGRYYVVAENSIGYHFWQSVIERNQNAGLFGYNPLMNIFSDLVPEKKHLYRRCILGADRMGWKDDYEYLSLPVTFCDRNGKATF